MPALRDGRPVGRAVGQFVALVDRHALADVGEHPGSAQASQAGPDDGYVFITPPHWVDSTRYIPETDHGRNADAEANEVG
ncbi:hypothetical protein MGAD_25170 [Mycolicibacterium gadium]|uniref:Uncharacterized protein n=1 Tax=Mycolicibacterium gadium TaxID=1794 RepID=A0A7I7WMG7_MYCGU|nr:hypothetical protein MGAD_25170 [Mycolicibacterium gadium]